MNKKYKKRGVIFGLLFGILIVLIHENYYEIERFFNINTHSYDIPTCISVPVVGQPAALPTCTSSVDNTPKLAETIFSSFMKIIQTLYSLPFIPFSLLGGYIIFLALGDIQFFVVIGGYMFIGFIIGLIYQKYKDKKSIQHQTL